jgi:hypothetical protein
VHQFPRQEVVIDRFRKWRDSIAVRIAKRSPPLTKVDCDAIREIADGLAEADADYAAGDTVSGEDLRDRYDLE